MGGFFVFLPCYIWYILSLYRFCDQYLNGFKIDKRIFVPLLLVIETAVSLSGSAGFPYILSAILHHILFTGLFLTAVSDTVMKKIFAAFVLIAVRTLAWNFGCSFFSCLVLILQNRMTGGQMIHMEPWLDGVIGAAAYIPVIIAQNILREKMDSVFDSKINSWYLMPSVLLICMVAVVDIANWGASNGIMVVSHMDSAAGGSLYYDQIFSHIEICILSALTACIAGGFVFFMNKVSIEQRQKEWYHSQIHFYKMLNMQYSQMERLRHDMKNHVLSLYGLWKGGEWDKIGNYLETMAERGNIDTGDEATGSKAVDALLYEKKRQAKQRNIFFVSDVAIPKECTVNEFDLCVLFGNILDNALNECGRMDEQHSPFINIMSYKVKKCLLISAGNSTVMKNQKEMKKGTGYLNIEDTIRKYNGTFQIKVQDGRFEIDVLLPFSDGCDAKQTI